MARDYVLRLIEQLATLLAALINRRKAGEIIQAREDLENATVRAVGFTLSEIKLLAPEEVSRIVDRAGALRTIRALTLAELLLLDARWREEDGGDSSQLTPNYVHAFCLIADALDTLASEDREHFKARLLATAEKLGELREHPYIAERFANIAP